jgi:hypothetical protein
MNQIRSDKYVDALFAKIAPDGTRRPDEDEQPAREEVVLNTVYRLRVRNPAPDLVRVIFYGTGPGVEVKLSRNQALVLAEELSVKSDPDRRSGERHELE